MRLKTVNQRLTEVVDKQTGELLATYLQEDKIVVDNVSEFFYVFVSIKDIFGELSGAEVKVLIWALINTSINNMNVATFTSFSKQLLAIKFNLSVNTINNAINSLVKKKILIRVGSKRSSSYMVSPKYFWKGKIDDRTRVLKYVLEVEYKIKDSDFIISQEELDKLKNLQL